MAQDSQSWQGSQKLILGAVALMLLPMTAYSFYLGWDAWHEGERLVEAPELPEAGNRIEGQLYRLAGPATGAWLNPPEIPEVKNALEFSVYKERQNADQTWTEIPHDYPRVSRVNQFEVKGTPVDLGKFATLYMPEDAAMQTRDLGGGDRLVIDQHVGLGQDLVVYGYYAARIALKDGNGSQVGGLTDGPLSRLIVAHPSREADVIQLHEAAGQMKASVLCGAGLLTLVLMAFVLRRMLR